MCAAIRQIDNAASATWRDIAPEFFAAQYIFLLFL